MILDGRASPCERVKNNRSKKHMNRLAGGMEQLTVSEQAPTTVRVKTLPNLHVITNFYNEFGIGRPLTPENQSTSPRTRPIATTAADPTLSRPFPLRAYGTQLPESKVVKRIRLGQIYEQIPEKKSMTVGSPLEEESFEDYLVSQGINGDDLSPAEFHALLLEHLNLYSTED